MQEKHEGKQKKGHRRSHGRTWGAALPMIAEEGTEQAPAQPASPQPRNLSQSFADLPRLEGAAEGIGEGIGSVPEAFGELDEKTKGLFFTPASDLAMPTPRKGTRKLASLPEEGEAPAATLPSTPRRRGKHKRTPSGHWTPGLSSFAEALFELGTPPAPVAENKEAELSDTLAAVSRQLLFLQLREGEALLLPQKLSQAQQALNACFAKYLPEQAEEMDKALGCDSATQKAIRAKLVESFLSFIETNPQAEKEAVSIFGKINELTTAIKEQNLEAIQAERGALLGQFREGVNPHLVDGVLPYGHPATNDYTTLLKLERSFKVQALNAQMGEKERQESPSEETPETTRISFTEAASILFIESQKGERSEYTRQKKKERCEEEKEHYEERNDYKEPCGPTHAFYTTPDLTVPWTNRPGITRSEPSKGILKNRSQDSETSQSLTFAAKEKEKQKQKQSNDAYQEL